MYRQNDLPIIKQVGMNGQISLGKKYAGKQIQMSKLSDGTIIIKPGKFIPDSEQWLHNDENSKKIDDALAWAEKNSRKDNFKKIIKKLEENE